MRSPAQPRIDRDLLLVAAIASAVSLSSFLYYFQRDQILLYGDAIAHINIARRVVDSQTPGLLQLGTVWLPFPHLLTLPFLVSDWMWHSGVGGSIPSMVAYIFAVAGVFRLARGLLRRNALTQSGANAGAWLSVLIIGANPNLLYLQATAMTESLYLAFFVWVVSYFSEWRQNTDTAEGSGRSQGTTLEKCAVCLAGAELTRYDGWFLAVAVGTLVLLGSRNRWRDRAARRAVLTFLVGIAIAPLSWLGYNWAIYRDPLEFARGPYSARAIELKTAKSGYPAHPGSGNPVIAASFFLKAGELNMAPGNWGRIWVAILFSALILVATKVRTLGGVMLLLWSPLVFYALSIAYGGVPIFLPAWWPYTWYNARYGLQFLPLFALSSAVLMILPIALAALTSRFTAARVTFVTSAVVIAATGASYLSVWRTQPLCFAEAWVNSRTKLALEASVARVVSRLPADSRYLMYVGDHVGVFQQAKLPLRQVINEGNHRPWVRPDDPNGLWERALANPLEFVDFVIACDGDAVDQKVNKRDLRLIAEIHTNGQPYARIYATRANLNQSR